MATKKKEELTVAFFFFSSVADHGRAFTMYLKPGAGPVRELCNTTRTRARKASRQVGDHNQAQRANRPTEPT